MSIRSIRGIRVFVSKHGGQVNSVFAIRVIAFSHYRHERLRVGDGTSGIAA